MPESMDNTKGEESEGGSGQPRHPLVGCCSVSLLIFILYIGVGGILARIEPEELAMTVFLDVLLGAAIVGLAALNARRPHVWREIIPALVFGVMCSSALIGWHCFTLHMRARAIEIQQEMREREAEFRPELYDPHPPINPQDQP